MAEIDPDFDEPQARPRSCTWPLRRPDFLKKPNQQQAPSSGEGTPAAVAEEIQDPALAVPQVESPDIKQDLAAVSTNRKNCSRRNAWGNLSYADLITKAIQSAPEQRLTLSQIYDWMVKNVPFFKDKGDSNSSAGWKNSIRHNLSLHSRFVRVQNEGTGKSSWWMINPDAKPGKSSRRRASSMDTNNPKWEKKRGRAKKKVLEERAKWSTSPTPNKFEGGEPESTLSLALSSEFRSRASSNASSCGRLSPINQIDDMHDNEVPPMSPGPYDLGHHQTQPYESPDHLHTDQLTSLAQAMSLNTSLNGSVSSELNSPVEQLRVPTPMRPSPKHTSRGNLFQNTTNGNSYMTYSPSPSYSGSDISPVHSNVQSPAYSPYAQNAAMSPIPQQRCSPSMSITDMSQQFSISVPQQPSAFSLMPHQDPGMTTNGAILSKRDPMLSHSTLQPGSMMHQRPTNLQSTCRVQTNMSQGRSSLQGFSPQTSPSNPLPMLQLNPAITASQNNHMSSPTHISVNPQYSQSSMNQPLQSIPINQSSDKVPSDLQNLDVDMFKGMDCDIDSIINHELCMEDGNMDFNFDGPISQTVTSSPNWVH